MGLNVFRRAPVAIIPLSLEGVVVAALVAAGALEANGTTVTASAIFPLDVYFDVKTALAHAPRWPSAVGFALLSILVRGMVLASTAALSAREPLTAVTWLRSVRSAVVAWAVLLLPALSMFVAVALRYAPFAWVAAGVGFLVALWMTRRAMRTEAPMSHSPIWPIRPRRGHDQKARVSPRDVVAVPDPAGYLLYVFLLVVAGAGMSILGDVDRWWAALFPLFLGPLHAIVLLGWREHVRTERHPTGGFLVALTTAVALAGFAGAILFDRHVFDAPPVGRTVVGARLLLLGGADSTWRTGALSEIDPRDFGFERDRTKVLSYARGRRYDAAATRRDPDAVARLVAPQIARADRPRYLLGHSQAAHILDRLAAARAPSPDRSVVIAPPPREPPTVEAPAPGSTGVGMVGANLARWVAGVLDRVGLDPFDLDAANAPVHVDPAPPPRLEPRLAVWALGDSVWLEGDWRRRGETNVVVISDHVGATKNHRTLATARAFFRGEPVDGDESSWRGALVSGLRYLFEPWRP